MPLLALGLGLLVVASAAIAACVRLPLPGFLLTAYLIAVAQIVLVTEALSAGHWVGRWGYLACQLPFVAAGAALWNARGRPRPVLPRLDVARALRAHPLLAVLGAVVGVALAYELFLALAMPPTTWDSMTYHLPRVVGWLQEGAVEYLDAHTTRQNVNPPNAEIQILYTFAFLGRDVVAALPQFVAQAALMVAIFGIARRLGYARPAATFAALLFPTLSQIALQATSTQNDMTAAAPLAAAAYFVLGRRDAELPLAALAIGVAVGTKTTVLFALPFLALLAVLVLRREQLLEGVAWAAAAIALFGAYGYVLNVADGGKPLGHSPENEAFRPEITVEGTLSTVTRITYRFADLSGFELPFELRDRLRRSGEFWFETVGIDANAEESTSGSFHFTPNTHADEDLSFFGPLGLLLVLPLSATFLVAWALRRVPREHGVLALALPMFVVSLALGYRYNAWIGRFMVLPVALVLPLAAAVYSRRLWATLVTATAVATVAVVHAENAGKELRASPWSLARVDALTVKQPALAPVYRAVEQRVPDDARVGILLGVDSWSYPLYGERLRRRLVRLFNTAPLDAAARRGLRWVVADGQHMQESHPRWQATRFDNGWTLFERRR